MCQENMNERWIWMRRLPPPLESQNSFSSTLVFVSVLGGLRSRGPSAITLTSSYRSLAFSVAEGVLTDDFMREDEMAKMWEMRSVHIDRFAYVSFRHYRVKSNILKHKLQQRSWNLWDKPAVFLRGCERNNFSSRLSGCCIFKPVISAINMCVWWSDHKWTLLSSLNKAV